MNDAAAFCDIPDCAASQTRDEAPVPKRRADSPPLVSVIIVTYRNEGTIEACLASLADRAVVASESEVVVVDNSPDQATWERLQAFCRDHPDMAVTPVRPGTNLGFAAGCNLGARHARGDFLLFLNPDTRIENDILSIFLAFWKGRANPGLLGPLVLDGRGNTVRTCRNLPTVTGILLDATGLDRFLGRYRLLRFAHDRARQVPQIIGACLFTSRPLYEAFGGMDERFFVYFEEVDLCRRMAEAGYEIWFLPEARISHAAGTSCETGSAAAAMIVQLRKSRMLYFRKHFGPAATAAVGVLTILEGAAKAAVLLALYAARGQRRHLEKAKGFWRVAACPGSWR